MGSEVMAKRNGSVVISKGTGSQFFIEVELSNGDFICQVNMNVEEFAHAITSENVWVQIQKPMTRIARSNLKDLYNVTLAMREYIDALPEDVIATIPVIPGFDKNWADSVIDKSNKIITGK
jgi:hypothetical protein